MTLIHSGTHGLRRILAPILGILLLSPLAACGSDEDNSGTDSSSQAATDTSYPMTVTSRFGDTTLDAEPTRIVALHSLELDSLLTLDIDPVGIWSTAVKSEDAGAPWYQNDALEGATSIEASLSEAPDYEAIAALKPDLILGGFTIRDQATFDQLNDIAPTTSSFSDVPDAPADWKTVLQEVGQLTGRQNEADRVGTEVDQLITDTGTEFPQLKNKTAVLAAPNNGNFMAVGSTTDPVNILLSAFGLTVPEALNNENSNAISFENYDVLDSDLLFFMSPDGTRQGVSDISVLDSIPAVKEGRVAFVDQNYGGAFRVQSALNLPYLIKDVLVPAFDKV